MPITHPSARSIPWRAHLLVGLLVSLSPVVFAGPAPNAAIGVVRNVAWSPGDVQREGACEFEIFLTVAQLRQNHRHVGLVGIGNHNGRLSVQAEQALENVALRGVAVAKLAPEGGSVARSDEALFVDAGTLSETKACQLLQTCIERFGPLPAAANPSRPTPAELSAIRRQLRNYQGAFSTANGTVVASSS